jgi:DNA-binding MarR family transcriptional regulator
MRHTPDARPTAFATVFVLAHHLERLADVALAPLGITTKQWLLLAVLRRAFGAGAPSLTEAAAVYGSSRQNVKAMALGLERAGYLRLVSDPSDARSTRLESTDKVAVFDGAAWRAREQAFFALTFGGLEPSDVAALSTLLTRWLGAVAPGLPDGTERTER